MSKLQRPLFSLVMLVVFFTTAQLISIIFEFQKESDQVSHEMLVENVNDYPTLSLPVSVTKYNTNERHEFTEDPAVLTTVPKQLSSETRDETTRPFYDDSRTESVINSIGQEQDNTISKPVPNTAISRLDATITKSVPTVDASNKATSTSHKHVIQFPMHEKVHLHGFRLNCDEPIRSLMANIEKQNKIALPKPSQVAIATVIGGTKFKEFEHKIKQNRQKYAQKHGYHYFDVYAPISGVEFNSKNLHLEKGWDSRNFAWGKLKVIQGIFEQNPEMKYVMWLDADLVITNEQVNLDYLLAQNKSIIVGGDENGLNSGSFLIRNDPWSAAFLQRAWNIYPSLFSPWYEQPSFFVAMVDTYTPINGTEADMVLARRKFSMFQGRCISQAEATRYQSQRHISSNVLMVPMCIMSVRDNTWANGDFTIHFAGISIESKKEMVQKYTTSHEKSWDHHITKEFVEESKD